MATNENKIITQGGCNEISPSIEVFSGSLTKCPTKSEINATKKKIVLEAGVNSNRKNLTSSYIEKQLVVYPDVGHYVECTYNGAITDIPYIEFLYNNQIVESFYPFTEQGVTGGEKSFVLGLTYSFFEYDWSKMTIRASFGGKTNSLSSYKLNGYSGEKNSDGSYFVWNTTYANNILTGLINHTLEIFVDENKYGAELEITPSAGSIYVGDTTNFKVFYYTTTNGIRDNNGVDVTTSANWKSSSDTVATVSSGVVTGKNEGSVTISASYNGVSDNVSVGVSNYISITPTKLSFAAIGEAKTVTVSATSAFSVSENLDWLSYTINGNTVSFTASENQTTSARNGSVTFSCGSKTVTLDVSQNAATVSYELEIQTIVNSIYVGDVINLTAIYHEYRNGKHYSSVDVSTKTNTIWETNDSNVATVSNGEVRGQSEGNAMISATYNGVSDSVTIGVYNYISINPTTLVFVATGQSHNVTVTATSNFSVSENLDWLSYTINGNIVIFTASENKTTNVRRGTVTFTCGSESVEMSVSQNTASATYELVVTPSSDSVLVGGTVKFTATYYEYRNGAYYADTDVTTTAEWETNDSSIATVSKGEVTGKDKGETTITASYNGASDSSTVSVYYPAPSLQVNPETIYFNQTGGNETFVVEAYNYSTITASRNNTWFTLSKLNGIGDYTVSVSSNPNSTQRTGSITITCVGLDGTEIERTVNVVQYASDISYYLLVTPPTAAIDVGDTVALTATYYREINGSAESLGNVTTAATWTTSSTSIATVSKGVVTGKDAGETTVTASYNGVSDSSTVSVYHPAPALTVTPLNIYIDETGGSASFTVSASNQASISASKSGSWFTLSKTSGTGAYIVSADENPYDSQRTGSVTITCVGLDGSELEETVYVTQYESIIGYYLSVSPSSKTVNVGSSVNLTATYYCTLNGNVTSEEPVTTKASWSSNSEGNATVSKGVVTGITGGTATVTAKYNGYSDYCSITVNDVYTYNFYISTWTTPINVGDTRTYKGFLETRKNGVLSISEITTSWKSSNTSVATISSGGIVTGLKSGTTTITGTATLPNGKTATDSRDQVVNSVEYSLIVEPPSVTIEVGETYQLKAMYYTITNGVSDSGVDVTSDATWDYVLYGSEYFALNNGLITGLKKSNGAFYAKATYGGKSSNCAVTVEETAPALTSLSVNSCYGASGVYSNVYAIATYSDGSTKNVTSDCTLTITDSSVNGVATINEDRVQHGAVGTATLNASYTENGITKTATGSVTTVKVMGDSITPTPSSVSIEVGKTASVTIEGVLNNGVEFDGGSCVYTGNSSYFSVSKNSNTFVITGLSEGTGTITFQHSTGGASCVVTVTVTSNTNLPEVYVENAYVEQFEEGTKSTIRLVLEMNDGSTIYPGGSYKVLSAGPGGPSAGTGGSIPMTFDTSNGTIQGGIQMTTSTSYYESNGTYGTIIRQGGVYFPIIT